MITELLNKLGFNDKEAEAYLAILKNGRLTVSTLAKTININRTTAYSIAKSLVDKGVISEDVGTPVIYLVAAEPGDLTNLIKKEERELDKKREVATKVIRELSRLALTAEHQVPKIVYVEDKNINNFLYEQDGKWLESILKTDGIWWGFQDSHFIKSYFSWINDCGQEPGTQKMSTRILTDDSEHERQMIGQNRPQRQTKFWNGSDNFTGTLWVAGDYIIMIVTKERPHYLVQIIDKTLSSNLREIFKQLWKTV